MEFLSPLRGLRNASNGANMFLARNSLAEIDSARHTASRFPVERSLTAEWLLFVGGIGEGKKRIAGVCRRPYQGRTSRKYGPRNGKAPRRIWGRRGRFACGFNDFSGLPRWRQARISRIHRSKRAPDSTPVSHANLAAPGKACDVGFHTGGVGGAIAPRRPQIHLPKGKNLAPPSAGRPWSAVDRTTSARYGFQEIGT